MISEVVIIPDCFDSTNDEKDLLYVLKDVLNNGIVIVDFSKANWFKYINENYIGLIDQGTRSKVITLLTQVKRHNKIVKMSNLGQTISSNVDWIHVSKLHNNINSIDMFLTGVNTVEKCSQDIPSKCHCINEILSNKEWDQFKEHNVIVKKTPESFVKQSKSILPHAKKVLLIDPYLEPNMKNRLALEIFAKYFGNRESLPQVRGTIEIHTKSDDDLGVTVTQSRWKSLLNGMENNANHTFIIYFWKDNSSADKFHDRFLLTDAFAISSLHSFSISDDSEQETTWGLLDRKLFEKYTLDYCKSTAKFQLECEPLVVTSV